MIKNKLLIAMLSITLGASLHAATNREAQTTKLFSGNRGFALADLSYSLPTLGGGMIIDGGLIGLGLGMNVGGVFGPLGRSAILAHLTLTGEYMIVNKEKWATGPELQFTAQFNSSSFIGWIKPGWTIWYAPFHQSVLFGVAAHTEIGIQRGGAVWQFVNGALRVGYFF